jgi:hypothetical protein
MELAIVVSDIVHAPEAESLSGREGVVGGNDLLS